MDLYCVRCKETKSDSEFGLRHDRSKGYKKSCLSCEDPNGTKRCRACGDIKSKTEFHRSNVKSGRLYWQSDCKPCQKLSMRKWRLAKQYGMSVEDYDRLLAAQGGVCRICGYKPDEDEVLPVDHDHSCCPGDYTCGKCVRGLLCADCNRGLGMFRDDVVRLAAAITYLTECSQ